MRVLITSGGCQEPVDGVRSLCNFSTGRTAAFLADALYKCGHSVTALIAEKAVHPERPVQVHQYRTFRDLSDSLQQVLGEYSFDLVIHAAAVSDYSPDTVEVNGMLFPAGKIDKIESGGEITIRLKENPKLIDSIKKWSKNGSCIVVAFKLTNGADIPVREQAVAALFARAGKAGPDFVVSNDLREITENSHPFRIYSPSSDVPFKESGDIRCIFKGSSKDELAGFFINRREK